MMVWLLIVLMAVVTYANRMVFLLKAIRATPSERFNVYLSYSSYAVLTAIWTPIVVSYSPTDGVASAGLDYTVAATLAALLAIFRLPSMLVVIISIGVFAAIRFLI